MRALLINPSAESTKGTNRATIYPPLGLLYISTKSGNSQKSVNVIDLNAAENNQSILFRSIDNNKPDIIGISANVVTTIPAINLAKLIRKKYNIKILAAGGPMPTVAPELFLNDFDIVIRNEGEKTFEKLLNEQKLESIDGISYKKNGEIIHNRDAELISDIDSLPFPDYRRLYPAINYYRSRARALPSAPILTSRGCPYLCTFCNKNIFGHKFRARTPDNVIAEIEYLIKEFHIKQIDILDDNFTLDLKRAEDILDRIIDKKLNIYINLQNGICADKINEKIIKKFKKAGVYKVGIGIESGNRKILKNIRKELDLDGVKKVIKALRQEDIIVYGFFMLGLPNDTPETMMDTINYAIEANPHISDFSITIPFPGTELFKWIQKNGKFLENPLEGYDIGFFSGKALFETEVTRKEDVEKYFRKAYRKFYLQPSKLYDILKTMKSLNEIKWSLRSAASLLTRR